MPSGSHPANDRRRVRGSGPPAARNCRRSFGQAAFIMGQVGMLVVPPTGVRVRRARMSVTTRRQSGALVAKRVVTGAKIGLRASGGKGIANKIASATMSSSTPKLLAKDVSASEPWSAFRLRRTRAVRRVCGLAPRPPVRLQSNATVATINAMTTAMRTPIPARSLRRRRFFRFLRFSCSWLRGRAKSSSVMSASAAQTL